MPAKVQRAHSLYNIAKNAGLKWMLVVVPLGYVIVLFYYSVLSVLKLSFYNDSGFTLQYIQEILTDDIYLRVLWVTMKTSLIVTGITLLFAYPIAYLLVVIDSSRWKKVIMGIVMISLWISLLSRTFTWTIILQDHGTINQILLAIGVIKTPLTLLYNQTGVTIGMTHILLPYMILNLYAVMDGIDLRLVQAAKGLGAKPWRAFRQVFLPLSLPGVMAGSLTVFVLGIGFFITPALLGGRKNMMISKLIQQNIQVTFNWNIAAGLSLILLFTTLVFLLLAYWVARLSPLLKGEEN